MSKVLGVNETGFGLLIERDAGYIDGSSLNNEKVINESFKINPDQPLLINCILQKWGVKNKNGRVYPKDILIREVERYQEQINTNSAMNEADHPDSSVVSLDNISHGIKKMWWGQGENQHVLYGQLEIITSPAYMKQGIVCMVGDKIAEYLRRGYRLGISSRGVGSLKEVNGQNEVQEDFELICFDLVSSPSTTGAYLFPEKNELQMGEATINKNKLIKEDTKILSALDRFLLN